MTISVSSLFTPQTPPQWLTTLLTDGTSLGLNATAWQDGQPIRTILEILGLELAKEDAFAIALRAQGGFLQFAAAGSVTFTDYDGNTTTVPVTPDPSIPSQNPSGAPGLLDTLAASVYGVTRGQASSASSPLYLCNTSGASLGTFTAGTFHVQNGLTGATYSNQAPFTLSAASKIGTSVVSASGSPVLVTTSTAHGLTTGDVVFAQSLGATSDNFYSVTVVDGTHFTLNGSPLPGGSGVFNLPNPPGAGIWATFSVVFEADQLGTYGNASVLQINQLITSAPKSYCGNLVTFAGTPWQSNASLAASCQAKLATLSPNGPQGAYAYFATKANLIVSGQAIDYTGRILPNPLPAAITLDGGPIVKVLVTMQTALGSVLITCANAAGPVGGILNGSINGVSATSPIVVETVAPHGCNTGDYCQVNRVEGIAGANGVFQLTVVDSTHVSLNGSTGTGTYTAGTGQFSGGDIYAVNAVLAAYCTPNAVTEVAESALAVTATIATTVYVPNALVSDYTTKMTAALQAYIAAFPVGGLNVDGQTNILPIGAVEGILYAAGQTGGIVYTQSVTGVTINGAPNDLYLSQLGVATLGSLAGIVVIGT